MSLIYAIGDVHGRLDLLLALLSAIDTDIGGGNGRNGRIVFLGDIIDRGPDSRHCLDLVIRTLDTRPGARLVLGNHEDFLLAFVDAAHDRDTVLRRWLMNGGAETLRSYGLDDTGDVDRVARHLADTHPDHVAALRAAAWKVETPRHVFVHGGIDPDLSLADQDPVNTRWIREKFLSFNGPLPKIVVHGHTVTVSGLPEIHDNRIALDTGAVNTGHLTCGIFDGDAPPRFLATEEARGKIAVGEVRALDFR